MRADLFRSANSGSALRTRKQSIPCTTWAAGALANRHRLRNVAVAGLRPGLPDVVLTREAGKNGPLESTLRSRGINTFELPLVETAPGPDREELPAVLQQRRFSWIVITSPEAASTFLEAWHEAGRPQVRVAVVGKATGRGLSNRSALLRVDFIPSKANVATLAAELPMNGPEATVLYPASAKAAPDLQEGLQERGFTVTRLNTYDTLPVKRIDPQDLALAKRAAVVAIASPSAIKSWVHFVGQQHSSRMAIACIGKTSATAAEKLGLQNIHAPENPGLDGFAESVVDALASVQQAAAV